MQTIDFELRGSGITLDALLKATGLAPSGGAAKAMVGRGEVEVDGQVELRKSCKLRAGQAVRLGGQLVRLRSGTTPPGSPAPGSDRAG